MMELVTELALGLREHVLPSLGPTPPVRTCAQERAGT